MFLLQRLMASIMFLILCALGSAGDGLTNREDIVAMYRRNEAAFIEAAETGDFQSLERVYGVMNVDYESNCIDIECGGAGLGSSTHYYGIFYSEKDDLYAVHIACGSREWLKQDGEGYRYKQNGGDNEYYVEPLGNHYFYYEAHY